MRPEKLGPYQLSDPLGKGGMGTVYRGVHEESSQVVAVKVLDPRMAVSEGFRGRFEAEIESLKALRHASIVQLLGYGEQQGVLFYAMELVDGPSLEDELRNGRRFDWREATQIAIYVARALKHAHDHGVIHRDLKPANILLTPQERPKLADFGIARLFGSTGMTIAGGVLGTADYMAPEQAAGKPVNGRCDQYSLGGVLYALLAGRPPFQAADLVAMLQLQRFAVPEPVSRFAPNTPAELESILAKMLQKEPADRFPNTEVVARRLEAMSQALSKVAADDFEIYQTGEAISSAGEEEDELSLAQTRDAEQLTPEPEPADDPRATHASGGPTPTRSTIYTQVDHSAEGDEWESSWLSILAQTALLLGAVGAVAGFGWWISRPVSADHLYGQIAQSVEQGEAGRKALQQVEEFQQRFSDDPRIEQVVEWESWLQLEQTRRKLQLKRLKVRLGANATPEETLLRRAANLAERDPLAGAAAFEALAELLRAGEAGAQQVAIADVARGEADRLRSEAEAELDSVLSYCRQKLIAAQQMVATSPDRARRVALAIELLLPENEQTSETLSEVRALLEATTPADSTD